MRPPDADVRDRIISARQTNISVEAGAGTGKTTLLVERVASLLSTGTPVARLAIITFTRKAASELGARLRRRLGEAVGRGESWAATALADVDRAAIGTTDSFCRSILADFPLESGLPPGFALVDEIAQEALLETAWERRLDRANEDDQRLFEELRELGVRPATLRSLGAELADHRDLAVAPLTSSDAGDLLEIFAQAFAPVRELMGRCTDPEDRLLQRVRSLDLDLRVAQAVGGAAAERTLLRRRRNDKKYATPHGKAAAWGGADGKAAVVDGLRALDDAVDAHLQARGAELGLRVGHWLESFVGEYQRLKRERGLVDFRDLALETRRLLATHPRLRRQIAARWDVVLLDEVQDTDPLQMEIAFLLAAAPDSGEADAEAGSDPDGNLSDVDSDPDGNLSDTDNDPSASVSDAGPPADPTDPLTAPLRPGGLFLVGDPKQSIYRFRRADIELYERARSEIARRGEALSIQANFRSHPAILRFVNHVFDGWMEPPPGEAWQARYEALLPGGEEPEDSEQPRASVLLPDPALQAALIRRARSRGLRSHERAELEIDSAVRLVRSVTGLDEHREPWTVADPETGTRRPATPGDVAVLVRKIAWGDRLADALRRAGVPANVSGGKRFHDREEIRTLSTLLDTILAPDARLARFAALRSPAFALSDDDLVRRFDPGDEPAESSDRLADAERVLERLGGLARELPVPEFLERLTEETALLATFGFRPDGPGRVEALRLLVEAADSLTDAGFDTLPKFVSWLKTQDSGEGRSVFGELDPGAGNSVEILTMHKAKGLEFPIVLLADLGSPPSSRSSILCDRGRGRIEFRLPGAKHVATPGWDAAGERERVRADAEEVRLLYVAMTRARDHLVLSWPEGRQGFLTQLPKRLDGTAGQAITSQDVQTLRVEDLPPVPEAARLHSVDTDAAIRVARTRVAQSLPFGEAAAAPPPADRMRIVPATVLARGTASFPAPDVSDGEPAALADDSAAAQNADEFLPTHFGSLIHKCLEIAPIVVSEGSLAQQVPSAWVRLESSGNFGPFPPEAERAAQERARLLLHRMERDATIRDLFQRMADAPIAHRETPFLVRGEDAWISGTVDVLLANPDGSWSIVDYKTGAAPAAGGPAIAAGVASVAGVASAAGAADAATSAPSLDRHRRQAALYAQAVHRLTGTPVREVTLLFLGAEPVASLVFTADAALQWSFS